MLGDEIRERLEVCSHVHGLVVEPAQLDSLNSSGSASN